MKSLITCFLVVLLMVQVTGLRPVARFDYGEALEKSLMFFEAQRSGKLPTDQRVKWRGDSGLKDGFLQGVDLVGGYYDSGDHVKFGLPMAYTVTMLSWGALDFQKEIAACNQLDPTLKAIRWGTDYFIKAHKQPNLLWGQVGDGDSDHYCWERAEDMSTPRTAYKIDSSHPGSDLAGETAAALAAASLAFKPYDSTYSQLLLLHAKQLFSFADRFRGRYDDCVQVAKQYYPSSGYLDELLWAAAWLFRATGDEYYLKYVVDNAVSMGGTGWAVTEFSWDNKYAGVQVLLSKVLMDGVGGAYTSTLKQYRAKAEYFFCACLQKNNGYNVERTPGGLLYVDEWNNMQYVSSAAFLMAVYSSYLSAANAHLTCPEAKTQPLELLKFAQSQADYILGKNPKFMSYLVGYGSSYPVQVHHRGASIESINLLPSKVGCIDGFEKWYSLNESNPNVIIGALVGGPDRKDEFSDRRGNYEQTEPSIAGSAPLAGLFGKLNSVFGNSGPVSKDSPASESVPTSQYTTSPIIFVHSITDKWTVGSTTYYRHKVMVKNTSHKTITKLKLTIEDLSGSIWGLSPCPEKNTFQLPPWINVLKPDSQFSFVYVQEGPQAKVSVLSYS